MPIIPYSPDHQEVLEEMYRLSYARAGWPFDPEGKHVDIRRIPQEYQAGGGGFWLLLEDGRLVGAVALRPLSDGVVEMKRLVVRPDARGRGYGRQLLRHAIEQSRARGCRRIRLDTTSRNVVALPMFRRAGFKDIPRYNDNPDAEFWMELDLEGGSLKIEYLADYPHFVPTLGKWFFDEWGWFRPEFTAVDFSEKMKTHLNRDRLPIAFIAVSDSAVVGTASLRVCDMDTRSELTPWLAAVFVPTEFRGQGIGSRLEGAVIQKTKELGYGTIYLYTFDQEPFYRRLNWTVREKTEYRNHRVTVMEKGTS